MVDVGFCGVDRGRIGKGGEVMYWQPDGSDPHVIGEVHKAGDAPQLVAQAIQKLVAEGGKVVWQPNDYCAIVRVGFMDWYITEMSCSAGDRVQMQSGRMRRD